MRMIHIFYFKWHIWIKLNNTLLSFIDGRLNHLGCEQLKNVDRTHLEEVLSQTYSVQVILTTMG